jgi:membrane protease subunit HflK
MSRRKINALFSAQDVLAALKSSVRILSWGMAVVIAAYLGSGITIIKPNEAGLILRFGKLVSPSHPPGLLYALPPPIDEVIKVPIKSIQEVPLDLWASSGADPSQTSLSPVTQPYTITGDVNIIRASFVVRFQVSDPVDYTLNARDNNALRDGILYQAACRVLSSMSVEDALTVGKNYIGLEALRIAQEKLDRLALGIHLLAFETREINPPAAVSPSFQSVVSAKVQAKTLVEQANAYAASSLPGAEAEAYRLQQEAESYAQQLVAVAQGQATAFSALLEEDRANPVILRARLRAEMLATVLPKAKLSAYVPGQGGATKILLAPKTGKTPKGKEEFTAD